MRRRPILTFLISVTLVSAVFEFMAIHYRAGSRNIMWGVTVATLITLAVLKRDIRTLGWGWGAWRYEWIAFLVPLGYCLVAYTIIWTFGMGGFYDAHFVAETRDRFALTGWSDAAVLAYFLPTTAIFGMPGSLSTALGEEIGWRGFFVPELSRSLSFTGVALTSGAIWAVWHFPVIILGNYHNNSADALPLAGQLVMFFTCVLGAAVIMAYLRLKSGSLWTGAIFHASHNLFVQTVFNPLTIQYRNTAKYADELGLVLPLTILPVAAWFLIRGRHEFPSPSLQNSDR